VIRAAIVGLGRWGRTLVSSIQGQSTAIRFVAGYTRTRASAEAFCAEKGIALKDDLDEILSDPAIDAVVFATPHSQHAAQVIQTAGAGKHVLMEKPFTLDAKSAEAALDAVARAGVVLGVAYPRRFHPAMIELRARIQNGRLGILTHCASAQTAPAGLFMSPDYWRSNPQEAPAGAMTATGVHNLDAMIYLFGRIDEVYCTNLRRVMARLGDTTSVMLTFSNGISATLFCSLVTAVTTDLRSTGQRVASSSRTKMSNSASRRRRKRPRRAAIQRPRRKSSSIRVSTRWPPNSKGLRQRSMAIVRIRSRLTKYCMASPLSRRSYARPSCASR